MNMNLPPESILANPKEILKACEIAEISGTPSPNSFVLVTQLASLLVLGQYNHARHLWRRYRTEAFSEEELNDSAIKSKSGSERDMYQFQLLWNAAQPLLQSYFGHVSILESGSNVFTSLQLCVDANLHPLSMFALEIKSSIRDQIANLIETVYDSIQVQKCQALLGKYDGENVDQYLVNRGWGRSNDSTDIWIPAAPSLNAKGSDQTSKSGNEKSKIEFLSNIVGFMEKQQVHS